jgi:protein-tyrosine phosphatase
VDPVTSGEGDEFDRIVFVCTGNAARSVMARVMLGARRPDLLVEGAGTHVLEGHPMSRRTRAALERHGLADPTHRSRQFGHRHVGADLILVMEPDHLRWIRRFHPEASERTTSLRRFLALAPPPQAGSLLADLVVGIGAAGYEAEAWEEVVDPAGGEQDAFDACADELARLVGELARRLP